MELDDPISLIALVVSFATLGYTVYKGRIDQRVSVKPALVFVYDQASGWQVQNIGAGPALNVIVALREHYEDGRASKWITPVRVPPLRKDGAFPIHWASHDNTHGFGATYDDIWDRPYSTTCGADLNVVRPGNMLREWQRQEIVAEWSVK
jgi:hypothetical protein